jgi:hypothetical protein
MKLNGLAASLAFAVVPCTALAAPCAGFSDVDTSSPFCVDVEWLKNRAVTVGCTVGTYCPEQFLTRLQMALFMRRFARVVEPEFASVQDLNAFGAINTPQGIVCETPTIDATNYSRTATPVSTMLLHGGPGINDVAATLVYRTPPNTLWQAWGPPSRTANQPGQPVSQAPAGLPLAMSAGSNYAFAIRTNGGTGVTPVVSIGQCALVVRVDNRN